ncbi:MAG TPA: 2Fe-2S iron-sulfur cluster-binding protein [Candidatus Dormibacteraeota bacterium]|nr:2Fe-2S iron-sulfur cluster-binding protein [Candidatus Dormibacteraeota bacterium]
MPENPTPPEEKDPNLAYLTIDGQQVVVPKGTLIVEAAKKVGIEIPVFCYHHKLDPVGACRLCLVEISPGPPRAQTACTTPVADGMTVRVTSQMAVKARADILEFELANHPLDCPVCDKGGECPLQDFTYRHGYPVSRVVDSRLHFTKPLPISPSIALDRERCVLCYRCTRYYDEIVWEQELTSAHRGVESFIATQFDEPLTSVFSGNIIDLCPVGALTSRVWRFQSRPWDMHHTASVCSKCSVGCNINLWERRGELMRVTSRENDEIDDGWICDRGRFDYVDVNDPERLQVPRVSGEDASWERAIGAVAEGIRGKGARLGVSLPQDLTNEEAFLFRRLLDGPLKGARVKMHGRTALAPPQTDQLLIREIESLKAIVLVASDLREDTPIVNLRVKKAVRRGAKLLTLNPAETDFDRGSGVTHVATQPGKAHQAVAKLKNHPVLKEGPVGILYGDGRGSEDVAAAVAELASALGAKSMPLYRATNERGALAAGVAGWDSLDGVEALLSWGPPPSAGVPASVRFHAAWDHLPREEHGGAQVVLPATTFAERQGSYTNLEGRVQFLVPPLDVEPPRRDGWEVLVELAAYLGLELDYAGIVAVQRAAAAAHPELAAMVPPPPAAGAQPVLLGAARP